jgi:hypothetical protein
MLLFFTLLGFVAFTFGLAYLAGWDMPRAQFWKEMGNMAYVYIGFALFALLGFLAAWYEHGNVVFRLIK